MVTTFDLAAGRDRTVMRFRTGDWVVWDTDGWKALKADSNGLVGIAMGDGAILTSGMMTNPEVMHRYGIWRPEYRVRVTDVSDVLSVPHNEGVSPCPVTTRPQPAAFSRSSG